MSKLVCVQGLQGSGKTYWAKQYLKESGYNFIRINRDSLRSMLFDGYWCSANEKQVVNSEKQLAWVALRAGKSVIIDDTNLTEKHVNLWKFFVAEYNDFLDQEIIRKELNNESVITVQEYCKFELKSFLDVPLETCILRDSQRLGKEYIGRAVIQKCALKNKLIKWEDKPIVIFDIDGTLADPSHRLDFVKSTKKNWNAFFAGCDLDKPNETVIAWCNELKNSSEYTIVIVSGRPSNKCQEKTLWWLDFEGVKYDYIFMRDGQDYRPDTEIKQEILNWLPKGKIEFVVDDRLQVVEMWRQNGIKCYPVGSGKEF